MFKYLIGQIGGGLIDLFFGNNPKKWKMKNPVQLVWGFTYYLSRSYFLRCYV